MTHLLEIADNLSLSVLVVTEFVEGTGYETRQTSKRDLFVRVLT